MRVISLECRSSTSRFFSCASPSMRLMRFLPVHTHPTRAQLTYMWFTLESVANKPGGKRQAESEQHAALGDGRCTGTSSNHDEHRAHA
jgi:hypothetical protein